VQASPPDFEIIKQLKSNVNQELNDLVHCVRCMRIIMLKKLSTAAEEEENHTLQLQVLQEKVTHHKPILRSPPTRKLRTNVNRTCRS
jgi:hypothetical protein